MVKGLLAYIRELARKDHLAEVLAAIEGVPLDAGNASGKGELLQRIYIGKSHGAYHLRIVWNDASAAGRYQAVAGRLEDGIAVGTAIEIGVVGRYNDLLQHVAAAERIRLDALDGARYIDTAEFLAVGKGTAVDELESFVQHYLLKVVTIAKSTATYLTERGWANHLAQGVVIVADGCIADHANALGDSEAAVGCVHAADADQQVVRIVYAAAMVRCLVQRTGFHELDGCGYLDVFKALAERKAIHGHVC